MAASRSYFKEKLIRRTVGFTTTLAIIFSGLGVPVVNANGCTLAQTGTVVTGIGTCSGAVIIPEGVTSIGTFAFQSSTLTSVTIPNSVTSIGTYAFYNARSLRTVTIGNGVTSIGTSAFDTNIALTSITFAADSALTSIGNDAFYNASSLTSITIPSGVTSIGKYAFYITGALKTVRFLGNTAPTVGTDAFFWYSTRTTRAITNNGAAKSTFTPIVDGKWNRLRVVTLAEADAEDAAVEVERLAAAAVAAASAAKAASVAAAIQREVEKGSARAEILRRYKNSQKITLELFNQAEIPGITSENIEDLHVDLFSSLPDSRVAISQVLAPARKYEVVGLIASDRVVAVYSDSLIEIGLIAEDSQHKAALTEAIKNLPVDERSSYAAIKVALDAKMAEIQARKDRLTAVLASIAAHRNG
jgi:hypothetical protein